jgi:hypothetical protein
LEVEGRAGVRYTVRGFVVGFVDTSWVRMLRTKHGQGIDRPGKGAAKREGMISRAVDLNARITTMIENIPQPRYASSSTI